MGNYKTLLVLSVLLAGTIYLPVLWLLDEYSTLKVYLASNISDFDNSTLSTSSSVPQHHYTFPLLMAIRIAGFIAFDAGNTLLDSSGLTMAQKYGGDFGKQKMWGTLAMVVLPILCGYLIDEISSYRGTRHIMLSAVSTQFSIFQRFFRLLSRFLYEHWNCDHSNTNNLQTGHSSEEK